MLLHRLCQAHTVLTKRIRSPPASQTSHTKPISDSSTHKSSYTEIFVHLQSNRNISSCAC